MRDPSGFFRFAGFCALAMALFIPLQVAVYVRWPPPATVIGWFELFRRSRLVGLVDLDLLLVVDQIFVAVLLVAVFLALKAVRPSLAVTALLLGLLGIAAFFASTVCFEMLSLAGKYAVATDGAHKTALLAAGEVLLATWQGTAFDVGYVMEGSSLLLVGLAMFGSREFGKSTAVVGTILGALSLVPPTTGIVGLSLSLASLVPLLIWDILVARCLFRLSRRT